MTDLALMLQSEANRKEPVAGVVAPLIAAAAGTGGSRTRSVTATAMEAESANG